MATVGPEVNALPRGMGIDTLGKGPYIQNMVEEGDELRVRLGFGQVTQFDTTIANGDVTYEAHLGSVAIQTDFGHEQVISVFVVSFLTRSTVSLSSSWYRVGQHIRGYLVHIHDVTTDEHWEELLYPKTASQSATTDKHHGLYETDREWHFEAYEAGRDAPFFFQELNDVLYFGSKQAGLWSYVPATFRGLRTQQINDHDARDWHFDGVSESSLVSRTVPADGDFSDAYVYLGSAEFPRPTDVAVLLGRLVLIDGRTVWFSDIGRPTSIAADNFISVPAEADLVAVEEVGGNLLLFTETQTYFYQPSTGALASAGRLVKVSNTIGCLGPAAVLRADDNVYWVDRAGAYRSVSGVEIHDISERSEDRFGRELSPSIKAFWDEGVSNPVTQYYQQTGFSSLASTQPPMQYLFVEDGVHLAYDHIRKVLFFVVPDQRMAWLWDGRWRVWTFESVAAAANTVRVLRNIDSPRLFMGRDDLYLVGSSDTASITDATLKGGVSPADEDVSIGSYYLMRYGRGGALDRSIEAEEEDVRRIAGKFYNLVSGFTDRFFIIAPWVPIPTGYVLPGGTTAPAQSYWLPVEVVPPQSVGSTRPDQLGLIFQFDDTHWVPIRVGSTAEIDFSVPAERLGSVVGYSKGAPVAGSSEVQVYSSVTGLADPNGDEVRVRWDGTVAGYTGPYAPGMNLNLRQRNRLIWLPFTYTGLASDDVVSMGLHRNGVTSSYFRESVGSTYDLSFGVIVWQQAEPNATRHSADDVAQPVDWVLKTGQLGLRGQSQSKLRTLWLKVRAHGTGTTKVVSSAVFGTLNALFGSDWKGWTSQVVDYDGDLADVRSVATIRSRLRVSTTMYTRVFNGQAKWGDTGNSAQGNFLVDDEQVDTVSISSSVKGEHVAAMLWGHIQNAAEALAFDGLRATLRKVAGRRRWGR